MHLRPDRIGRLEDVLCSNCKHATMHTVRSSYETRWDVEDVTCGGALHDFLTCNGCGAGTYRTNSWSSEDQERTIRLHPPRGQDERPARHWPNVPWKSKLKPVYRQTITAFNNDLMTLAGAGVRLLIEGICIDKSVANGPVSDKAGAPLIDKKTNQPLRRKKSATTGLAGGMRKAPKRGRWVIYWNSSSP